MLKNTAGQKIALFAFDVTTGLPVIGDAANLDAFVNIDWAGIAGLTDSSATEIDDTEAPGWYLFDLTQGETNGETLHFTGTSSTGDVVVVGQIVTTVDPAIASSIAAIKTKTDKLPNVTRISGAVVDDALNSASTFETNLSQTETDHFREAFLTFTSGALAGQTSRISAYNGSTKFVTAGAYSAEPTAGDTFDIINS